LLVAKRWPLSECAVRAVLVEMLDVDSQHALEVAATENQQPVEALAANTSNPALGMGRAPSAPAPAP
jgi:hypothetical protein